MQKIFVGDVQGCGDEFQELLDRARNVHGDDFELWCVGDLINRGPQNLRVLQLMRELVDAGRGYYVLGNHELALLGVHFGWREMEASDSFDDISNSDAASEWIDWLRTRPLVETGRIDGSPFAMVHASVHPDWSLSELRRKAARIEQRLADSDSKALRGLLFNGDEKRDAELAEDRDVLGRLTRCRGLLEDESWTSEPPTDERNAWHRHWAARMHGYGVVYGHWAMQGLNVEKGLRGLDTGCVHHGRGRDGFLTAWLPTENDPTQREHPEDPFGLPDDRFWKIPARQRYRD
jgi:bis(5'-nucleosyl)-tetraphosphatase (symmetrical)